MSNPRFWLSTTLFLLLFLVIAGYAYYRTWDLRNGPIITISSPQNNEQVTTQALTVSGTIKNATSVTLDDRKIFLDEQGNFSEKLLLASGYTIITIKAEDQFNRSAEKQLAVVFTNN